VDEWMAASEWLEWLLPFIIDSCLNGFLRRDFFAQLHTRNMQEHPPGCIAAACIAAACKTRL
jgi:hypothetical protein